MKIGPGYQVGPASQAIAGPIKVTFYQSPTLAAGGRTPLLAVNRRPAGNASVITAEQVAAANVSAVGTKFQSVLVPSASAAGALPSIGASGAAGVPFELDLTKDYLIEIDNENGADAQIEVSASWFEIP